MDNNNYNNPNSYNNYTNNTDNANNTNNTNATNPYYSKEYNSPNFNPYMQQSQIPPVKKKKKFQSSQSEIVVKDSTKKEIVEIISSLIAKDDLSLVLEVVETKKSVYIRKKVSTK